jgi:excisionase family DNA binding protein
MSHGTMHRTRTIQEKQKMNDLSKEWISTSEAAQLTGYSQEYIRKMARDGVIVSQKIGVTTVISKQDLLEYARKQKEKEG